MREKPKASYGKYVPDKWDYILWGIEALLVLLMFVTVAYVWWHLTMAAIMGGTCA